MAAEPPPALDREHRVTQHRRMRKLRPGRVGLVGLLFLTLIASAEQPEPRTEITKWQDGKQAAISLTFDDNSINQFRVAMPLLNERGFKATFFIITGRVPGSRYRRSFVGRPLMEIIRESKTVPTTKDNALERMSMLLYLQTGIDGQQAGSAFARGQHNPLFRNIEEALAKLRQSGTNYEVRPVAPVVAESRWHGENTWDAFRRYAAMGHEFASHHTVSHQYMSALDDVNLKYELEKSLEDIRDQLGPSTRSRSNARTASAIPACSRSPFPFIPWRGTGSRMISATESCAGTIATRRPPRKPTCNGSANPASP